MDHRKIRVVSPTLLWARVIQYISFTTITVKADCTDFKMR